MSPHDIKKNRESNGLTQAKTAQLMDVTTTSIYNWENGLTNLSGSARILYKIITAKCPEQALNEHINKIRG